MSLNLSVYELDIARLRAAQGSNDWKLLERVLDEHRNLIKEHDLEYENGFPSYLPLASAVRRIIEGRIDPTANPLFQYEHAAALLAATLGEPLDSGLLRESHPELWEEADIVLKDRLVKAGLPESALPLIDKLLNRGPALDIPIDDLEPLGTGHLTNIEVREAQMVFSKLDLEGRTEFEFLTCGEDAVDVVQTYASWIEQAAAAGLGLFFHA